MIQINNWFVKLYGTFKVLFRNWKMFLFFFVCMNLSIAQNEEFGCTGKMNEFSQWKPVTVNITVQNNTITVNEVIGIELKIKVDKRFSDSNGGVGYILTINGEDNVRMMYQMRSPGTWLVSVLNSHYLCILKANN